MTQKNHNAGRTFRSSLYLAQFHILLSFVINCYLSRGGDRPMFTRLLLGSVLGTMLVAFSSTASVNAQEANFGNLFFDLQLMGFLESELLIAEVSHAPKFVVTFLEQDIRIDERLITCASLGHCNVSPF